MPNPTPAQHASGEGSDIVYRGFSVDKGLIVENFYLVLCQLMLLIENCDL